MNNNLAEKIEISSLEFQLLNNYYPRSAVKHLDSKKVDVFDDHCAIHISEALYKCGVLMHSFKGVRCWHCPTPDIKGRGIHIIRAQELSDYLNTKPFSNCPKPLSFEGVNYEEGIKGKTGIVFFKDYWQRNGEKGRTGDHIDLWNKNELVSLGVIATLVRQQFPSISERFFSMSDLRQAKQVLFWEIN